MQEFCHSETAKYADGDVVIWKKFGKIGRKLENGAVLAMNLSIRLQLNRQPSLDLRQLWRSLLGPALLLSLALAISLSGRIDLSHSIQIVQETQTTVWEKPRIPWTFQLGEDYACNITTEPFQLELHGLHGGAEVTYASSDEEVARVDQTGQVTVTGPGEAVLTVTAAACSGHAETSRTVSLSVDGRTGVEAAVDALLEDWPAGSYFSINGEACHHYSRDTCKNCQLQYILRSLDYDWELNEDYKDGWTCYAWARFFYRSVFGEMLDTEHAAVIAEGDPADPATFAQAQPGDVLWLYRTGRESKPRHMAIFIGVTEEGLFLYDNNVGGGATWTGCIRYGVAPYERVDANWSYCKVLHAGNYEEIADW